MTNARKIALPFLLIFAIALLGLAKIREHRGVSAFYQQTFTDKKTIREYFETHSIRKLQLGAGINSVAGWLNTDIEPQAGQVYLDATADYPFPDGSFHYILAEQLIEHLSWEGGLKMLKECHRVLAPGGKIRVLTPDLVKLFGLITDSSNVEMRKLAAAYQRLFHWPENPVVPAYVFNKVVHEWGHTFIYDPATLRKTFELAGFTNIIERPIGERTDPVFEQAEVRTPPSWGEKFVELPGARARASPYRQSFG